MTKSNVWSNNSQIQFRPQLEHGKNMSDHDLLLALKSELGEVISQMANISKNEHVENQWTRITMGISSTLEIIVIFVMPTILTMLSAIGIWIKRARDHRRQNHDEETNDVAPLLHDVENNADSNTDNHLNSIIM